MTARGRVLAIMGSGETSPTMVTVHKMLAGRLGARPDAVVLDAPYAFQENAADVSPKPEPTSRTASASQSPCLPVLPARITARG